MASQLHKCEPALQTLRVSFWFPFFTNVSQWLTKQQEKEYNRYMPHKHDAPYTFNYSRFRAHLSVYGSMAAFAKTHRVHPVRVSEWADGSKQPPSGWIAVIMAKFGGDWREWFIDSSGKTLLEIQEAQKGSAPTGAPQWTRTVKGDLP